MSDFYLCEHQQQCCGSCIRGTKTENNKLASENSRLRAEVKKKEKAIVQAHTMMGALETIMLELETDRKERVQKMIDDFREALSEGTEGKGT